MILLSNVGISYEDSLTINRVFSKILFGSISDNIIEGNFSDQVFETAVDHYRYILKAVKPKRCKFSYENFAFTALDSIDAMERLYKTVDDKRLGIHLDASNLVTSVRELFDFNQLVIEASR